MVFWFVGFLVVLVGWFVIVVLGGVCLGFLCFVLFVCLGLCCGWLVLVFLFLRLHGSTEREEGLNNVNDQQLGTHFFL